MTSPVRHFLDLTQFGAEEIRGILAASVDMKRARKRGERRQCGLSKARRWR